MGEGRTPRPEPSARDHYERVRWFALGRRTPIGRSRPPHLRPLAGFVAGYAALPDDASPLSDAFTAHGEEAASTLTLPHTRRGREQTGCCQLLRFAACLTRPDGTSARVPWGSGPVETTHPQTRDSNRTDGRLPAPELRGPTLVVS